MNTFSWPEVPFSFGSVLFCETGSYYVAQAALELVILLPPLVGFTGLGHHLHLGCSFLTLRFRRLLLTHSFLSLLLLPPISWGIEPIWTAILVQPSPLLSSLYSRLVLSSCEVLCPSILRSDLSALSYGFSEAKTHVYCCCPWKPVV